MKNRKKNKEGLKIHNWTILEKAGRSNGKQMWRVQCSCGREYVRLYGQIKNCKVCLACYRKPKKKIEVGYSWGNWTVISNETKRITAGKVGFLCRCKCGLEIYKPRTIITREVGNDCKKCYLATRRKR